MKNVLVIGNAASVWTKEYIKNTHVKFGHKVWVTYYDKLDSDVIEFYKNLNVKTIDLHANNKITKIFKYYKGFNSFFSRHKTDLDLIDIQSPPHSWQSDIIAKLSKKTNAKVIVTFWGSDILRITDKDSKRLEKSLKISKWINIGTLQMHEMLRKYFGTKFDDKCIYIGFGGPALTYIRDCNISKSDSKIKLGLDPSKLTVAVGYNGNRDQQHIEAIKAIGVLDEMQKDKIQLLIHLVSCQDDGYIDEIIKELKEYNLNYVIIRDMLDLKDIAIMRVATDIFVHAQISDGLSGSIREAVYAGSTLLNPSWIKYDKFDKDGVEYIQFSDFLDLTKKMRDVLNGDCKIDTKVNKTIIYDEYSWQAVEQKWLRIFNE